MVNPGWEEKKQSCCRSAVRGHKPFRSQSNEAEHLHHLGTPSHDINVWMI